jgi:adhesin transport system membrane fusion protein
MSSAHSYFHPARRIDNEFMPEVAGVAAEDSSRRSRITVWLAAALIITALVWARFAVLEEVTMGEGKAIPSSKVQVIQNLEGGIVTEIFVREGQIVNKGDTLLRLDDTRFLSNKGESEVDKIHPYGAGRSVVGRVSGAAIEDLRRSAEQSATGGGR